MKHENIIGMASHSACQWITAMLHTFALWLKVVVDELVYDERCASVDASNVQHVPVFGVCNADVTAGHRAHNQPGQTTFKQTYKASKAICSASAL